jgi:hypothetical protein
LCGREREIGSLRASLERVVAGGTSELVLVSGYSGIGKSSVVNELDRELVPPTLSNSRTQPKVIQREAGALAGREPAEFSASVTAKTALIPIIRGRTEVSSTLHQLPRENR